MSIQTHVMNQNMIYNTKEVSILLKVSTRTIQRWRDSGVLKYSAIGTKFYYFHTDVMDMLKQNLINIY